MLNVAIAIWLGTAVSLGLSAMQPVDSQGHSSDTALATELRIAEQEVARLESELEAAKQRVRDLRRSQVGEGLSGVKVIKDPRRSAATESTLSVHSGVFEFDGIRMTPLGVGQDPRTMHRGSGFSLGLRLECIEENRIANYNLGRFVFNEATGEGRWVHKGWVAHDEFGNTFEFVSVSGGSPRHGISLHPGESKEIWIVFAGKPLANGDSMYLHLNNVPFDARRMVEHQIQGQFKMKMPEPVAFLYDMSEFENE